MALARTMWTVGCLLAGMLVAGCGSEDDDPAARICNAAATELSNYCELSVTDDRNRLHTLLQNACMVSFTDADLESAERLEALCLDALDGADVTDADVEQVQSVLDTKASCSGVADTLSTACREFRAR